MILQRRVYSVVIPQFPADGDGFDAEWDSNSLLVGLHRCVWSVLFCVEKVSWKKLSAVYCGGMIDFAGIALTIY